MSVAVIGAKLGSSIPLILFTVSLLIGVPLAYRYYRDIREGDDSLRDSDLLADLVQGDAASKMTEAEFRRVRDLLSGAETGRSARNPPESPRRSPKGTVAARNRHEPHPGELAEPADAVRENPPETDGTPQPSG